MTENGVNTDKIFDGSGIVIGRGAQADVYSFHTRRLQTPLQSYSL